MLFLFGLGLGTFFGGFFIWEYLTRRLVPAVEFYIEDDEPAEEVAEEIAEELAETLRDMGWEVKVGWTGGGDDWLTAELEVTLRSDAAKARIAEMEAQYDGDGETN